MSENDFVTLRMPRDLWDRASAAAEMITTLSGNAVVVECVKEMLDLADAPPHARFTPKIVRMIDGAKAAGVRLEDEPAPVATRAVKTAGRGKHVVKGGRG